jgi:hypothetical protein
MLSITSSQPAVWSPAPGPAVTAVSPTVPVQPVQATSRDAQTGTGTPGRDAPPGTAPSARPGAPQRQRETDRSQKGTVPDAAPLLPRESPDAPDQPDSPEKAEAKAEAERELQARQAEDKAFKQKLQDVISNVWKASAAVVDVALSTKTAVQDEVPALGAPDAATRTVPAAAAAASGSAAVPATVVGPVPGAPVQQAANDEVAELAELRAGQEVVAYDAAGHSSLAPLEAGTLISRRV